jgi:(p)ppGpp synthase/HD superfamily hydrolase
MGGRIQSEWVADFDRNGWPVCVGISGRFRSEYATAPVLIAAWLHDSLEDTALTRGEVESRFGSGVAELVWRVTDEPGASRKERKVATYQKTRQTEASVILKLADRIANVEAAIANHSVLLRMYSREQADFKNALQPASASHLAARMWSHLDQLLHEGRGRKLGVL